MTMTHVTSFIPSQHERENQFLAQGHDIIISTHAQFLIIIPSSHKHSVMMSKSTLFRQLKTLQNTVFSVKMSSTPSPKYFLLTYKYVDNVLEKRAPLRTDHLNLAKKYADSGKMLLGGAFANPVDGAAVVFKVNDKREVEEFVQNDPYVNGGIVTRWEIR